MCAFIMMALSYTMYVYHNSVKKILYKRNDVYFDVVRHIPYSSFVKEYKSVKSSHYFNSRVKF